MRVSLSSLVMALGAAAAAATAAVAGDGPPPPPTVVATSETETRGFVGLNWTFGKNGSSAEGVLGIARVKTDSDGDSRGAKLSVHLPISNGLSFGKIKLTGLTGENDRMLEAGLGFGTNGAFGTAGLWAPYVNGGVDIGFGGDFEGYAGFTTLDGWDVPPESVLPPP